MLDPVLVNINLLVTQFGKGQIYLFNNFRLPSGNLYVSRFRRYSWSGSLVIRFSVSSPNLPVVLETLISLYINLANAVPTVNSFVTFFHYTKCKNNKKFRYCNSTNKYWIFSVLFWKRRFYSFLKQCLSNLIRNILFWVFFEFFLFCPLEMQNENIILFLLSEPVKYKQFIGLIENVLMIF